MGSATFIIAAAVLLAAVLLVRGSASVRASWYLRMRCRARRAGRRVALTFDDGPDPQRTPAVLDLLARQEVRATFFVVGDWADKYPESVKALHDAGHEVMNHSNTHAHYPQLSVEEIVADLNACNDKIEAITGVRPTLVRLPYGDYDDNAVRAVRSTGMEPIQWDVDTVETASSACGSTASEGICNQVTNWRKAPGHYLYWGNNILFTYF